MVNIDKIINDLEKADMPRTEFVKFMEKQDSPFIVLISCILSLRTKDETTYPATMRMLKLGKTPEDFLDVSQEELEKAIYPVGFYRNKARDILDIARTLVQEYDSNVPESIEEMCKLKGVGRKTANLTMAKGFNKPAICVDIHVHRICNRWGYVATNTPDETEMELRGKLPKKYWMQFNTLIVTLGQNICKPVSPKCEICPISDECISHKF